MKKLSILHKLNSIIIFVDIVLIIIFAFTKLITDIVFVRIFVVVGLLIVIILQTVLASKITKKIRSTLRKENIEYYFDLTGLIEKRFREYIFKKEVLCDELAEYKYYFKSDCIEFTLWFDDYFIACFDTYSKLNHYHFTSWEYEKKDMKSILNEIRELLNGDYLFGDILLENNKIANTFCINLKEMDPSISNNLDNILDDFFDEPVFRKNEYKLKIYGSKKFGEIEMIWKGKE